MNKPRETIKQDNTALKYSKQCTVVPFISFIMKKDKRRTNHYFIEYEPATRNECIFVVASRHNL